MPFVNVFRADLCEYIDSNELSNDNNQFGFRRRRTVDDQLLLTYGMLSTWYDVGFIVDVVLFDFTKAFDIVSHYLLLELGICSPLIDWIADFLIDCVMRVSCIRNSFVNVRSGVP